MLISKKMRKKKCKRYKPPFLLLKYDLTVKLSILIIFISGSVSVWGNEFLFDFPSRAKAEFFPKVKPLQKQEIEGKVTDTEGFPLSGVSVRVKGTDTETSTDEEGGFSIEVEEERSTLIFSFIGFESQEVALAGETEVTVELKAASSARVAQPPTASRT